MGEHISDQMVAYMDGRMSNRADDKTAPHGYAHQIAPFAIEQPQRPQSPEPQAQPRISVWDRLRCDESTPSKEAEACRIHSTNFRTEWALGCTPAL